MDKIKKNHKRKSVILVTVLIILVIITMTVLTITLTTIDSQYQVRQNIEYYKSYSYAESRIINMSNKLATPDIDIVDLIDEFSGQNNCQKGRFGEYICSFKEDDYKRTVLKIYENNSIEEYELSQADYFDVVLEENNFSFNGKILFSWLVNNSFDLELIYEYQNQLDSIHQIIDQEEIFSHNISSNTGFLKDYIINNNSMVIDLSNTNLQNLPSNVGSNLKLKLLRIKSLTGKSTTININSLDNGGDLPKQVRVVEALTYDSRSVESASPLLIAKFPKSPSVPFVFTNPFTFKSMRFSQCGNNIREGRETCDTKTPSGGACRSDCTYCGDGIIQRQHGETCEGSIAPNGKRCRGCSYCGDKRVNKPYEHCDDGNSFEYDWCTSSCCGISDSGVEIIRQESINDPYCPGPNITATYTKVIIWWNESICFKRYEFPFTIPGEFGPYYLEDGGGNTPDYIISYRVWKEYNACGTER